MNIRWKCVIEVERDVLSSPRINLHCQQVSCRSWSSSRSVFKWTESSLSSRS